MTQPQLIQLTEYQETLLPPESLPYTLGETLWREYGQRLAVEFPSPKTGGHWRLTSQGWVGYLPLTPGLIFLLQPKVALSNLFRMVEVAYRLNLVELDGLIDCQSLAEFYERLAHALARRILDRGRKGFYRAYLPRQEPLPYLRGRLDTRQAMALPSQVNLNCHYQEHTADVEENQILAWTLWGITRSGLCTERTLPLVRRAYRALQGRVSLAPQLPQSCIGRFYNRLNQDYQPLHALCRFFLEQTGPTHHWGDHKMFPFLINMASLYEQFVAEWVATQLPPSLRLKPQEKVYLGEGGLLNFAIDLVLYDTRTGQARCVLDTKYKRAASPDQDDIFQIIAYAEAKGCDQAILIYPTPLAHPLDEQVGGIRVRTLTFALEDDLTQAGQIFLQTLLEMVKA